MESKARLSGRCHAGRTMLDVVASRRQFLIATAGGAAIVSLPMVAVAAESEKESHNPNQMKGKQCMNRITTKDGTEIYFKAFPLRKVRKQRASLHSTRSRSQRNIWATWTGLRSW